jgi:hypothetical protein
LIWFGEAHKNMYHYFIDYEESWMQDAADEYTDMMRIIKEKTNCVQYIAIIVWDRLDYFEKVA